MTEFKTSWTEGFHTNSKNVIFFEKKHLKVARHVIDLEAIYSRVIGLQLSPLCWILRCISTVCITVGISTL